MRCLKWESAKQRRYMWQLGEILKRLREDLSNALLNVEYIFVAVSMYMLESSRSTILIEANYTRIYGEAVESKKYSVRSVDN